MARPKHDSEWDGPKDKKTTYRLTQEEIAVLRQLGGGGKNWKVKALKMVANYVRKNGIVQQGNVEIRMEAEDYNALNQSKKNNGQALSRITMTVARRLISMGKVAPPDVPEDETRWNNYLKETEKEARKTKRLLEQAKRTNLK